MKSRIKSGLIGLTSIILGACAQGPTGPSNSGGNTPDESENPRIGDILFTSNVNGSSDVYVMDSDATNVRRLTDNPASDYGPVWSLDKSKIAFTSNRDGNAEIYVMDADGSNEVRLTNNSRSDEFPSWSPDGDKIAYANGFNIKVMNADGTGIKTLTQGQYPSWSPRRDEIVFNKSGNIYRINQDGTDLTEIYNNGLPNMTAEWSPNGNEIAFVSLDNQGKARIKIINRDETNLRTLGEGLTPSWGPYSSKIIFTKNGNIAVSKFDGSDVETLLDLGGLEGDPDWK